MGNLKPFLGIHDAKPVFTIAPRCYLPISHFYLLFSWCWHVHWWGKSNAGGNGAPWYKPGSWAQTTLVVGTFFTSCTSCRGTPPVSLKNVLDEAVKSINGLKSRLWIHLFLIFHAVKWKEERTLNTPATYQGAWLSRGKTSRLLLDLGAGLATFFKEHHFCLKKKKQLTVKLRLFSLGYLANCFSKMNEGNLELQKNLLAEFVAVTKFTFSSEN